MNSRQPPYLLFGLLCLASLLEQVVLFAEWGLSWLPSPPVVSGDKGCLWAHLRASWFLILAHALIGAIREGTRVMRNAAPMIPPPSSSSPLSSSSSEG